MMSDKERDALRTAREHISGRREEDFRSFTVNGDAATMDSDESAIIKEHDDTLAAIDAALSGEQPNLPEQKGDDQWWHGTLVPTGQHRLRKDPWGHLHLQSLMTNTAGQRKRWITIPTAEVGTPDDA